MVFICAFWVCFPHPTRFPRPPSFRLVAPAGRTSWGESLPVATAFMAAVRAIVLHERRCTKGGWQPATFQEAFPLVFLDGSYCFSVLFRSPWGLIVSNEQRYAPSLTHGGIYISSLMSLAGSVQLKRVFCTRCRG